LKNILIIETNPSIAQGLSISLHEADYLTTMTNDSSEGIELAIKNNYDLIIADVFDGKLNVFEICAKLRDKGIFSPIIIVIKKDDSVDPVHAVISLANDCLIKPFSIGELIIKIKSVISNSGAIQKTNFGFFSKYAASESLRNIGNVSKFSAYEYKIFLYFLQKPNTGIFKDELLEEIWGFGAFPSQNTFDAYFHALQHKLSHLPDTFGRLVQKANGEYSFSIHSQEK